MNDSKLGIAPLKFYFLLIYFLKNYPEIFINKILVRFRFMESNQGAVLNYIAKYQNIYLDPQYGRSYKFLLNCGYVRTNVLL